MTTATTELTGRIQTFSPEQCAELVTKPSSDVYFALKQKIQASTLPWIQGFLDEGGLARLLDTLVLLSQTGQREAWSSVCDAVLQLDCLGCVRELVNYRGGMECLLTDTHMVDKLTLALDTPNVFPKKQIFELLTCVAIAAKSGHSNVIGALENYQKEKHQAHRFTVILHEMKLCENSHYRSTLLGFINALIQCSADLRQRCHVRDELIGLKILDVINFMKKDEKEPDFCVQMKVFYESKQRDEVELAEIYSMDFQDPVSIFEAIHKSMVDTPELTSFLHVLQDMYRIDTSSCDRRLLWQTLAKVTYTLSNLHSERDAQHVLTKVYIALDNGIHNPHMPADHTERHSHGQYNTFKPPTEEDILTDVLSCSPDFQSQRRKEVMFSQITEDLENDCRDSGISLKSNNASPPLPCYSDYDNVMEKVAANDVFLLQQQNPIMLTQPFQKPRHHHNQIHRRDHLPVIEETELDCIESEAHPEMVDSTGSENKNSASKKDSLEVSGKLLKPESLEIVAQVAKRDTFDVEKVGGNVTTRTRGTGRINGGKDSGNADKPSSLLKQVMQKKLNGSQNSSSSLNSEKNASTKMVKWVKVPDHKVKDPLCMWRLMQEFGRKILPIDYSRLERDFCTKQATKADISGETSLLHPDVSLALNLFLSRLETHPEFVVQSVRAGELQDLGVEAVRHLLHILPPDQEIKQLDAFISSGGNIYDLGDPEQLLLSLSEVPAFRLHLSAYLFTSDFATRWRRLREAFAAIVRTCEDVVRCERLRDFMRCALRVGNFLNKDTHLGKVDGVSLATWHRLSQVKCNNNHDNLLSWLVKYISDSEDPTLHFLSELPCLEKAAGCDLEEMKSEVQELNSELKKFVAQLNMAPVETEAHFSGVMESVTRDLELLHGDLQMTRQASHQLMVYLCEEDWQFDIQSCLQTLHRFVLMLTQLREESSDRQMERQVAGRRVKQMIDKQIDNYFQDIFTDQDLSLTPHKKAPGLVDHLLSKLQRGEVEEDYLGGHTSTDYKHLHSFVLPEHDSQRFSPDRNLSPVVPSHSTPSKADESVLVIPELRDTDNKKTFADRADQYIKNQYRRDRQVLSASFIKHDNNTDIPRPKPDDHSPDTGTKPFPHDMSSNNGTKAIPVAGGVSLYENMQAIDDIMMNVQTYEQNNKQTNKQNDKHMPAISRRAGAFTMDLYPPGIRTGERRDGGTGGVNVAHQGQGSTDASGRKFFFGLEGNNGGGKDTQRQGTQTEVMEEVKDTNQQEEKEMPVPSDQPQSAATQRPQSKLGILKRFSKAILRQQDGNVQPTAGDKQPRKTVSMSGDVPTDSNTTGPAPLRTRSLPMPRKAPQMGTMAGSTRVTTAPGGTKYQTKSTRTTIAANDKENRHQGTKTKPESKSLKNTLFRRQPKLEKSSSSVNVERNKGVKKVPLQKSNSAPVVEEESMVIDAHVIEVIENEGDNVNVIGESDYNRVRPSVQERGRTNSDGALKRGPASSSAIPAFSRRNALPTRDKNVNGTKTETLGRQKTNERCVDASGQTQTLPMYRDREIIVKPSYNVKKDEELMDRVIDSKNVRYKTTTLPGGNAGHAKTQTVVTKDKEARDGKFGTMPSNNRFGFGWKERKNAGVNEKRASESGVIPTAPKHEIQQANKCTLKIYRKYNMQ